MRFFNQMDDVWSIYAYLYSKVRKRIKGNLIQTWELRKTIERWIICDQNYGGSRKGVPKYLLNEIILEMEQMELIKKIDHAKYQILTTKLKECKKKIKENFPWA